MSNIQNPIGIPVAVASGGTGTTTAFTLGSVIFASDSGVYNQNNANFFWDNTNNRLGIGTVSPGTKLHIIGAVNTDPSGAGSAFIDNAAASTQNILEMRVAGTKRGTLRADSSGNVALSATAGQGLFLQHDAGTGGVLTSDGNFNVVSRITNAGGMTLGSTYAASSAAAGALSVEGVFGVGVLSPGYKIHVYNRDQTDGITTRNGSTTSLALIQIENSVGSGVFDVRYYGSGAAGTIGGLTAANSVNLVAQPGANHFGLGTFTNFPMVFWTNGSVNMRMFVGGGLEIGTGATTPGAFRLALKGGTATTTGDWALTSGWGASATISAVTGNDTRGTVTVTTNAADTPSANPVITLTFKDGTWTNTPFPMANMDHASTGPSTVPVTCNASPTTLVISYRGTPTATSALTYKFNYVVLG